MSMRVKGGTMSNTNPPKHFEITTTTTDTDPASGYKSAPNSILVITGEEEHGYLSAHRNTARMCGRPKKIATVKSAKYNSETGEVIPQVSTYWI